eukprot:2204802-Ditylum_brightwellii.AAC.1
MAATVENFNRFLVIHNKQTFKKHEERLDVDLSSRAMFNGMTSMELPSKNAYEDVYASDNEC